MGGSGAAGYLGALIFAAAHVGVQDPLPEAQVLGRDLEHLDVAELLNTSIPAHLSRHQAALCNKCASLRYYVVVCSDKIGLTHDKERVSGDVPQPA